MRRLAAKIAEAKKQLAEGLASAGIDTTGEKLDVPPGFLRIDPETAKDYERAGHHVVRQTVLVNGAERLVTLVSYGDPDEVTKNLRNGNFFPKPNEA